MCTTTLHRTRDAGAAELLAVVVLDGLGSVVGDGQVMPPISVGAAGKVFVVVLLSYKVATPLKLSLAPLPIASQRAAVMIIILIVQELLEVVCRSVPKVAHTSRVTNGLELPGMVPEMKNWPWKSGLCVCEFSVWLSSRR